MQGHVQVAHGHRRSNQGSREAGRFLSIRRVKWPPVPGVRGVAQQGLYVLASLMPIISPSLEMIMGQVSLPHVSKPR